MGTPEFNQRECTGITATMDGDVCIASFNGPSICETDSVSMTGEALFNQAAKGASMVLDFSGVEFLNSAFLNTLLLLNKRLKQQGKQLILCNMPPEIQEVFVITRLSQFFDIQDTRKKAIALLAQEEKPVQW